MERFFVAKDHITKDKAWIHQDELKHLSKVLRMQVGDALEIFDGAGQGFLGQLASITSEAAEVHLKQEITEKRESNLRTCLVQGIPKGEKMEWVVQKATELGVSRIIPLELSRSIVKLDGKKRTERQQRWQKVAAEAARQSGRLTIPTVMQPMNLTSFLQQLTEADKLLVPWEEGGMPLRQALTKLPPEPEGMVYFMIGPEGGLTTAEVQQAKGQGGQNVTLGPRILRTETAGLALLAILQYEWGDVGQ